VRGVSFQPAAFTCPPFRPNHPSAPVAPPPSGRTQGRRSGRAEAPAPFRPWVLCLDPWRRCIDCCLGGQCQGLSAKRLRPWLRRGPLARPLLLCPVPGRRSVASTWEAHSRRSRKGRRDSEPIFRFFMYASFPGWGAAPITAREPAIGTTRSLCAQGSNRERGVWRNRIPMRRCGENLRRIFELCTALLRALADVAGNAQGDEITLAADSIRGWARPFSSEKTYGNRRDARASECAQ
jgi:hypothetical protein